MKLTNNTILITGGSSGIGYELTKQLTARGNTILITGRDQSKMERAKAASPKIHIFRSDVSDPKAIATLYEQVTKQFPDLNILINNAGIMREINVHDKAGSLEDITREIEINLSGPIRMVKQFLPHLKTKSEAAIMNVSSGLAFVPLPISPVYCATKAGLHSFTESLRVQLKNTKVKVFELAPPATQTELLDDFNSEDMKGVSIMKVEDMVNVAVKGMQADRFEIRPGQAIRGTPTPLCRYAWCVGGRLLRDGVPRCRLQGTRKDADGTCRRRSLGNMKIACRLVGGT